ncbi:hypothetical protein EG349_15845 [Chryseobacterium shandongense]|uniref:ABC-three component systems C-terminal domain-containing protein n=1 Tax=Chryseobacterium shandongense TaxID=1493872 RepID=A0AAD1DMX0_9FLAO|nr:ABC-three component system protein [Chryseobacterium shandongense]AZA88161.1 hypothetical protein EG349_15845 [Chryseobacterium shandongense]AZA96722.1 hypothetical protein EG353_14635 [Chryseobacterium shandongense]
MGIHAPGQVLGYGLQFPRVLYHLLRCEPEDKVAIEVIGDVATIAAESLITEEDKSSQIGNPVTDLSTDLWKTFFNWVGLINNGKIDVAKTKFVLYVNKKGRTGIVNTFNNANTIDKARIAFTTAMKKIEKKIDVKHEIWPYYDFLKKNQITLLQVINNFELQISSGGGAEAVKKEIRKKHISESQIDFIQHNLAGWVQTTILEKLANKEDGIISWEEFDKQFQPLFERSRKRELIDFALTYPPEAEEISKHLRERPLFIRQLDHINANDDEIQDAVKDYLRAKVNRQSWIENGLIDETTATDFQSKLTDFWKNKQRSLAITHKTYEACDRGMLLYIDCRSRQETIRDQHPPSATIAGTYHLLANSADLGWHPDWENTFKSKPAM